MNDKIVILIDDEYFNNFVLQNILAEISEQIICVPFNPQAQTAEEQFGNFKEFFQKEKAQIACVITDHDMPVHTGTDYIRWIRETNGSTVPIGLISAQADLNNLTYNLDFMRQHNVAILTKPIIFAEFKEFIDGVLSRPSIKLKPPTAIMPKTSPLAAEPISSQDTRQKLFSMKVAPNFKPKSERELQKMIPPKQWK